MISFNQNLVQQISDKKSFLIVGLDPNLDAMPIKDIFQFNKVIIDSTFDCTSQNQIILKEYRLACLYMIFRGSGISKFKIPYPFHRHP